MLGAAVVIDALGEGLIGNGILGMGRQGMLSRPPLSPRNIAGLTLWLDASQITGLSNGDPVAQWDDRSGNANHATQGTAAKRPTYQSAAMNGRPAVVFDGVDDYLKATNTATGGDLTIFAVATISAYLITNQIVLRYIFGDPGRMGLRVSNNNDLAFWGGTDGVGGGDVALNTPFVATASRASTAATAALNGDKYTGTITNAPPDTPYAIGGDVAVSQFLAGSISEVIVYNRALSDAERKRVERYLGSKYGIAVAP